MVEELQLLGRGAEVFGELAGSERSQRTDVIASEGWRVAGMIAVGCDRLDGFQLIFVPRDSSDERVRMSDLVGSHLQQT